MRYSLILILMAVILAPSGGVSALPATDYIWQEETVADIAPAADRYRTELKNQVLEMINTGDRAVDNGCLQPALYRVGILGSFMLYGSPAETVYMLSDAYPLLDATTQASVKAYLTRFMSQYPPLTYRYIHGTQGWGSVTLGRNRREYYPIPAGFAQNVWPQPAVPIEVCYVIWRYADATGDWTYLQNHMSEIQAIYNAYDNTPSRYGEIMGLIGMARIADHFGNATLRDAAATKASSAIAASSFDNWLATANTTFNLGVHDWAFPLFHYIRGTTTGAYFCPEIGRLIGTDQVSAGKTTTSVRIGLGAADHAKATYPGWFAYKADYCYGEYIYKNIPEWQQNCQGGENAYNTPDFSWTFFMLRAYLYGDSAGELGRIVDTPTCVGDLFYFQKLAVLIRSHGTRSWTDVRSRTAANVQADTQPAVQANAQADVLAPAAVGNLAAGNATPNSVTLTWTAPGDDGFAGTAKAYDIRYSTTAITEASWSSATQTNDRPTPKAVGQAESLVVTGLTAGTTYYFGVRTADEVPNWSALSNVPGLATAAGPATTQAVLPNLATFPVIAGTVNPVSNSGLESDSAPAPAPPGRQAETQPATTRSERPEKQPKADKPEKADSDKSAPGRLAPLTSRAAMAGERPADGQAERRQTPTTAPADPPAKAEPASRPVPAQPADPQKSEDHSVVAAAESMSISTASGTAVAGQAKAIHAKNVTVAFTVVQQPDHGSVEMQADGAFTYTPDGDYIGEDSFTFWVDDGQGYSDPATVSITVHSPDDQMSLPIPEDDGGYDDAYDDE